jgi:quinol monooxygenase YgiN
MSKVSVIAKLVAQPGKRDELADALASVIKATSNEPGTQLYILSTDDKDAETLYMYEIYDSKDALDAHMAGEEFKALGKQLGPLIAAPPELHFGQPLSGKGL